MVRFNWMNLTTESKLDLLAELLYRLHTSHISGVERYGKFQVSDSIWFKVRDTPWNYLEVEVYTGKKRHTISFNAYDYNISSYNGWRIQSYSAPSEVSLGEVDLPIVRHENLSASIIRSYIENIPTVSFIDAYIKGLKILLAYTER